MATRIALPARVPIGRVNVGGQTLMVYATEDWSRAIRVVVDNVNAVEAGLTASQISFIPSGGIAATTVKTAIEELDTEKQPKDATLTAVAGVTTAADKLIYWTGVDTAATTDFSAFARTMLDDANAAAARTTLGLGTAATANSADFQPADSELTAIAGLVSAADRLPYFTGAGTAALATFTAAGRALVDDADAAAQRATLGLGTIATQAANNVAITGGAIDNTPIGATAANTGKFTSVESTSYVKTASTTVGSLPAAATAGAGARHFVTDATATTFLSVVAGGGANKVPVVSDGASWLIG